MKASASRLRRAAGVRPPDRDEYLVAATNGGDARSRDRELGSLVDLGSLARDLLGRVPGVTVLVFDRGMRIALAAGEEFDRIDPHVATYEGRTVQEALFFDTSMALGTTFREALAGVSATRAYSVRGSWHSVRVTPLLAAGEIVGAVAVKQNVTLQHRLESALSQHEAGTRDAERVLASTFDRAPIGMAMVDLDGGWLRVNDAYCLMHGYAPAEILETTFLGLAHPEDVEEDIEWMRRAALGESERWQREERHLARDGTIVWVDLRAELIRDDHGQPGYTLSLVQNITERRAADGILRASEQRLRSILDNTSAAVFVKGRDHRYQLVNSVFEERLGLEPGWILGRRDDAILPKAAVARDRESDDQVLSTGDPVEHEQTVLHEGEDHVYQTVKFALRDEHEQSYAVCGIVNDVTDRRRREGESQVRLEWTNRIQAAVADDRLVLYGQPIVDLGSCSVAQAELLVRMVGDHGRSAVTAPSEFLPAAERFDLVAMIDQWVVAQAIALANQGRHVEVNLSGKTVSDPAGMAEIERLVATMATHPENIIFQITETAIARNLRMTRRFVERLQAHGCRFALDDFGVGFGAFTYLKHLPVSYLKIDLQFVRDLVHDSVDRRVVESIVAVARAFAIKTVAEGVEDQHTLDLLGPMGVDYAQGYWIGRPLPIDELWAQESRPVAVDDVSAMRHRTGREHSPPRNPCEMHPYPTRTE